MGLRIQSRTDENSQQPKQRKFGHKKRNGSRRDESEDGQSSNTHNDQDSDVSFENDTEEEVDAAEVEEEEWMDYMQRSTNDAIEKMGNEKIRCWKLTKMKWRLLMRIATSPSERRWIKAADWNPEFRSKYRTNRAVGRPRKRWEDDINEFLKLVEEETELDRKQQPNQQNMDQHSKRPRKMDTTRRKLHKEFSYENEKKF